MFYLNLQTLETLMALRLTAIFCTAIYTVWKELNNYPIVLYIFFNLKIKYK